MGIRAGDRKVLCTKNVLPVPQGASGKLPFSPVPYGQPGVIYFSSEIKISPSSCWEDRTKLPADYYSRTKQSIYLSRFRAIISPGHKLQHELPLSTAPICPQSSQSVLFLSPEQHKRKPEREARCRHDLENLLSPSFPKTLASSVLLKTPADERGPWQPSFIWNKSSTTPSNSLRSSSQASLLLLRIVKNCQTKYRTFGSI